MGDWADCYEAFGYDISRIPDRKISRQKAKRVTVSLKLTKEERDKYMELGGAQWVKTMLRTHTAPSKEES